MINLVGAAEQVAVEAAETVRQAEIDKDAAGAAFDKANAAKVAVDAADERERKRRELAASAEGRAAEFAKADAVHEAAVTALESAKANEKQIRDSVTLSVQLHRDVDFIFAQAVEQIVKEDVTDTEILAKLPAVVDDLRTEDVRFRVGEFGGRGVSLDAYGSVIDNPQHWLDALRHEGKFTSLHAKANKRWTPVANIRGYIEMELAHRSVKSPNDKRISGVDRERRVARIEAERKQAVAWLENRGE